MKKTLSSIGDWFKQLLSDERGVVSSKRLVGIICAMVLCISLYNNAFTSADMQPSDSLVDAVALLAFGCLGLTSLDKFVSARQIKKNKENENE